MPLEDAVQAAVRKVKVRAVVEGKGDSSRAKKLRDRHHTIARLVAANLPKEFICRKMGMTWNTLTMLIDQTPAFQELVAGFRAQAADPTAIAEPGDYMDILERVMVAAELEIQDRLMEEPEKLSISELHKISRDAADRLGFSKHSVNLNVNITLAERLEGLRRRSRAPAGAGDSGGVLSTGSAPRSAPPLLELKAEAVVQACTSHTLPTAKAEQRAEPPQPPSEGALSLQEVMRMHGTQRELFGNPKPSRFSRNPTPPDAATRVMSDRIRPRNTNRIEPTGEPIDRRI